MGGVKGVNKTSKFIATKKLARN